uniref:Uncharacterized protein n=1 Tax=Arundo donax TaxID=35708 RepID=A0A0A9GXL3_ARUDO
MFWRPCQCPKQRSCVAAEDSSYNTSFYLIFMYLCSSILASTSIKVHCQYLQLLLGQSPVAES